MTLHYNSSSDHVVVASYSELSEVDEVDYINGPTLPSKNAWGSGILYE